MKTNKEESSISLGPDMEMFKTMLEGAEIDYEENSPNGIVPIVLVLDNGIVISFSGSGELLSIEVE